MANAKTKKPAKKPLRTPAKTSRSTVGKASLKTPAKQTATKAKSAGALQDSQTVQLLVVVFTLLSVIFMAMAYYAYA